METKLSKRPTEYSSLALAYLGDSVYEVFIRSRLLAAGNFPVQTLHTEAIRYVCAKGQSDAAAAILPMLTEEEAAVYRRGKNAKPGAFPKHADPADYHRATGFEALAGWLYLNGRHDRLEQLFCTAAELIEQQNPTEKKD